MHVTSLATSMLKICQVWWVVVLSCAQQQQQDGKNKPAMTIIIINFA